MRATHLAFGVGMLGVSLAMGCTSPGSGRVRVSLSGEQPAITGYPFDDGEDEVGFVDGWTLQYTRVLVSVAAFELRGRDGASAGPPLDAVVADLHLGPALAWELSAVSARRWERLGYDIVPPTASARALPGVLASDIERMRTLGVSLIFEGAATDGTTVVPFSFALPDAVRAYDCVSGFDGTEGLVVGTNAVANAELTFHLDHVFLDSVASKAPPMRFEPLAALAGPDRVLTLDDLALTPVTEIRDREGNFIDVAGHTLVYDPGPLALDPSRSIASYVRASATTIGHLDGEGHCRYLLMTSP